MANYRTKVLLLCIPGIITYIAIHYSVKHLFLPARINTNHCDFDEEHLTHKCQEDVYSFHCPKNRGSIFTDHAVYNKCLSIDAEFVQPLSTTPPLEIKTKCSKTNLILLSYQKPRNHKGNSKHYIVPNTVHYIWFSCKKSFSYLNYLSFYSVNKFIKPDMIILHGDCIPHGNWWLRTIDEVANLYSAYMKLPRLIQGRKPSYVEHGADISRLQILFDAGGIYLDMDVLALRSLDELRNYPTTLGKEKHLTLANGIILAKPKAPFICIWLEAYRQYRSYRNHNWNTYSCQYPYFLSFIYKSLVHVEKRRLVRPNMDEAEKDLYNGHFDWSKHYTIHVWKHSTGVRIPMNESDLMANFSNCSIGDIMKYIIQTSV